MVLNGASGLSSCPERDKCKRRSARFIRAMHWIQAKYTTANPTASPPSRLHRDHPALALRCSVSVLAEKE
jgi:hypothetical protein